MIARGDQFFGGASGGAILEKSPHAKKKKLVTLHVYFTRFSFRVVIYIFDLVNQS